MKSFRHILHVTDKLINNKLQAEAQVAILAITHVWVRGIHNVDMCFFVMLLCMFVSIFLFLCFGDVWRLSYLLAVAWVSEHLRIFDRKMLAERYMSVGTHLWLLFNLSEHCWLTGRVSINAQMDSFMSKLLGVIAFGNEHTSKIRLGQDLSMHGSLSWTLKNFCV